MGTLATSEEREVQVLRKEPRSLLVVIADYYHLRLHTQDSFEGRYCL
jgi:hypothetical protein